MRLGSLYGKRAELRRQRKGEDDFIKTDSVSRSKLTETHELDEEWALIKNGARVRLWS